MQSLARKPKDPAKSSSQFSQSPFSHSFTLSVNCSSIPPAGQDGNLDTPRHPVHGRVLSLHLCVSGSLPQAELLIKALCLFTFKDPSTSWPQPLPLLTLLQPHWPFAVPPRTPNCFLYNCSLSYSLQQHTRVLVSPHPHQHYLLSAFLITGILVGVKWYLTVV